MADLTNYALNILRHKKIDHQAQIAHDRINKMPQSLIVLKKGNFSDREFKDYVDATIIELKLKYDLKRSKVKLSKYHEVFLVEDKIILPD